MSSSDDGKRASVFGFGRDRGTIEQETRSSGRVHLVLSPSLIDGEADAHNRRLQLQTAPQRLAKLMSSTSLIGGIEDRNQALVRRTNQWQGLHHACLPSITPALFGWDPVRRRLSQHTEQIACSLRPSGWSLITPPASRTGAGRVLHWENNMHFPSTRPRRRQGAERRTVSGRCLLSDTREDGLTEVVPVVSV